MEEVLSEETIRIVKSTAPAMKQVRSGIPFPLFLPNREKILSVRKHPILRLTTSSLSSLMTQHGYRICTTMFETLFAEHPSLASMFRKEDHTVQPGESYERQPLLVAQAVRHSPRFLFLAPDSHPLLILIPFSSSSRCTRTPSTSIISPRWSPPSRGERERADGGR